MSRIVKEKRRRVFLVDDHPLVREWLSSLLNQQPDLAVCGEAADTRFAGSHRYHPRRGESPPSVFRYMRDSLQLSKMATTVVVIIGLVAVATVLLKSGSAQTANSSAPGATASSNAPPSTNSLDLPPQQLNAIKIAPVGTYLFPTQKEAVGNINYVDDLSVQVFPNYQGKLLKTFVELGDDVQKGQALYTIDSPDLVNAESTLIGAEATFELTDKELARAKNLSGTNGVSQSIVTKWSDRLISA